MKRVKMMVVAIMVEVEVDDTSNQDFEKGFRDRMAGYYDKWYRYNRQDSGQAYDRGVESAVETGRALPSCVIIPCLSIS